MSSRAAATAAAPAASTKAPIKEDFDWLRCETTQLRQDDRGEGGPGLTTLNLTLAVSLVVSLRYLWELLLTGRLAMPSEHHLFCLAATRPETSKSPARPPGVE